MSENDDLACMTAAVNRIGDRWTLLILWLAIRGTTRFEVFQRRLGIARATLANRLARMVDDGIMEKQPVQTGARRLEYRLTDEGRSLAAPVEHLAAWGASLGQDVGRGLERSRSPVRAGV